MKINIFSIFLIIFCIFLSACEGLVYPDLSGQKKVLYIEITVDNNTTWLTERILRYESQDAMNQWNNVECNPYFFKIRNNFEEPLHGKIIWEYHWQDEPSVLASIEDDNGLTVIRLNASKFWSDGHDLLYVLLHELGHYLGLCHSDNENAVMYSESGDHAMEETKKQLHQSDKNALCAEYPIE
jgi:hypothetical protein